MSILITPRQERSPKQTGGTRKLELCSPSEINSLARADGGPPVDTIMLLPTGLTCTLSRGPIPEVQNSNINVSNLTFVGLQLPSPAAGYHTAAQADESYKQESS